MKPYMKTYVVAIAILTINFCISLISCVRVPEGTVTTTAAPQADSTIVGLKKCQIVYDDIILDDIILGTPAKRNIFYRVYQDTVTNTVFVSFQTDVNTVDLTCFIPLVMSDGSLKPYRESDVNELTLIGQGDFLVFEDVDTKVQYIVRLPSEEKEIEWKSKHTYCDQERRYIGISRRTGTNCI